jgi:hypothetical protein
MGITGIAGVKISQSIVHIAQSKARRNRELLYQTLMVTIAVNFYYQAITLTT